MEERGRAASDLDRTRAGATTAADLPHAGPRDAVRGGSTGSAIPATTSARYLSARFRSVTVAWASWPPRPRSNPKRRSTWPTADELVGQGGVSGEHKSLLGERRCLDSSLFSLGCLYSSPRSGLSHAITLGTSTLNSRRGRSQGSRMTVRSPPPRPQSRNRTVSKLPEFAIR